MVTDRRATALRVKRGIVATGGGRQDVFVVRDDRAVRTRVGLGLELDYDAVEGLCPGTRSSSPT